MEKVQTGRGFKWLFSTSEEKSHLGLTELFQKIGVNPPDISSKTDIAGNTVLVSTVAQKHLALFLALHQRICFSAPTDKETQENYKRLLRNIISGGSSIVAVIIAWSGDVVGTAAIQYTDHYNGDQYWINEVCKTGRGQPSPIPLVMNAANTYIKRQGAKSSWLMVEINPVHGFGAGLNSYYANKYGYVMRARSGEYTTMELPLNGAYQMTQPEIQLIDEISKLATEASESLKRQGIEPKMASTKNIPVLQENYEKIILGLPSISMSGGYADSANKVQKIEGSARAVALVGRSIHKKRRRKTQRKKLKRTKRRVKRRKTRKYKRSRRRR